MVDAAIDGVTGMGRDARAVRALTVNRGGPPKYKGETNGGPSAKWAGVDCS